MKRLIEYINEYQLSLGDFINEGASGINLLNSKNLEMFHQYLNIYFKDKKCIIGDTGFDKELNELKDFISNEGYTEDIFFYVKINNDKIKVCLYKNSLLNVSDDKLNKLGIYRINNSINKYKLKFNTDNVNWISSTIEATQKKFNKSTIKLWPDNLQIINAWHPQKCDDKNKFNYNFGSKKAYLIPSKDFNSFGENMYKVIYNSSLENAKIISSIFLTHKSNNIKEEIKRIKNENKNIFNDDNLLATIISEPLSIYYTIYYQEDILKQILGDSHKNNKITNIIIPISQNYKIADFLIEINENTIIPISVKSGDTGGNKSSILSLLSTTLDEDYTKNHNANEIPKITIDNNDISFLKTFVNSFSYNSKKGLLSFNKENPELNKFSKKLQTSVLDLLEYYNTNSKKHYILNRNNLIKFVYNEIVNALIKKNHNILNENEIHNLLEIGKNGNLSEKFFTIILNKKGKVNNRLAKAIGKATHCTKITIVKNDYSYKVENQIESKDAIINIYDTSHLNKYKVNNVKLENNKLILFDIIEINDKTQGQALAYLLYINTK